MAFLLKGTCTWALTQHIIGVFLVSYSFAQSKRDLQNLKISYFRPGVGQQEDLTFANFANDFESFNSLHKQVVLDVCDNVVDYKGEVEYRWTFQDRLATYLYQKKNQDIKKNVTASKQTKFYADQMPKMPAVTSSDCQITWYAPREGSYNVRVTMRADSDIVARGGKVVDVRDIWYVAIGDSYMSGQGNPDQEQALLGGLSVLLGNTQAAATWIDAECYQSSLSHPFLIYEQLEKKYKNYGILFTFIACSGASIEKGVYSSHVGKPPQMEVIQRINRELKSLCPCDGCCKTVPDVIYQGLGANDLDFEELAAAIANPLGNKEEMYKQLPAKKQRLRGRIDRLDTSYRSMKIPSQNVFYVEYFDPLRNEKGNLDASCPLVGSATLADFRFLDKEFLNDLNQIIRTRCRNFGWHYLDFVDEAYRKHGICSKDSYIRTIAESFSKQGNLVGAYHPNDKGHAKVAEVVWKQLEKPVEEILDANQEKVRVAWTKKYSTPVRVSASASSNRRIKGRRH